MSDRPSLIGLDAPAVDLSRLRSMRGVERPADTPTFMETARAGFTLAQADRAGDDEQAVIDAYGPLVTELSERGNPATRYVVAARGAGRPINEDRIWADITAARRIDKKAFAGVPATRDQFRADVLARYRGEIEQATSVAGRGGLGGSLAGGLVGGLTDPINVGTMWIGGGVGGTAARRIAREALVNAGVELFQQPLIGAQRAKTGRDLTLGEAAANVALGGVAGGAFAGFAVGGKALARRYGSTGGELARAMRDRIGWGRMTDAEQAAVRTLEREDEIVAASPFQPGPSTERYAAQVDAIVEAVTAPGGVQRATDIVPDPVPRQRPLSTAEAAARLAANPWEQFKAQVRRAESGGDDAARNPRSSATGRYQVIDDTWLRVARTLPGSAHMSDAGLLGMRSHPVWQEKVMDALGVEYRAALARAGAAETPGNLYLMHFAGTGSGAKILRAAGDTPIEELLSPGAITANPFLRGKSADDVIDWAHGAMRSERSTAPVLRRDIFPEDDAGDTAFREAQREVEAAERDWADWTRDEVPPGFEEAPRAVDWGEEDIPFDIAPAAPGRTLYHGTRGAWQDGNPNELGMTFFGETRDIAERYAEGGGGRRQASGAPTVIERSLPGDAAILDVRTLEGARVLADLPLGGSRADELIRAAQRAVNDATTPGLDPGGNAVWNVSHALWSSTKNAAGSWATGIRRDIVDALRTRGYAGIQFTDDAHSTIALFDDVATARAIEPEPPEPLAATTDMERYWSDAATSGERIEPLYAVRDANTGALTWWTASRQQAQRMLRESPERYTMERIDPPDDVTPSARREALAAFDDPDGDGVTRQIDSLEHDLRMFLEQDEAAGLTVRLDEEGDVISAADLLDELDGDEAAIATARACMVPGGGDA